MKDQLHIVFLHLDLGIGGAEQLVVNLALASLPRNPQDDENPKSNEREEDYNNNTYEEKRDNSSYTNNISSSYLNAKVSILTTHCDQSHCFDAVRHHPTNPGKLAHSVHVLGSFIPANFCGYGTVFFSTLRMLYLSVMAACVMFPAADVYVLDVLPTPIPFLIWLKSKCVIYYCHFPDKLLTRDTVNGIYIKKNANGTRNSLKSVMKSYYRYIMDGLEEWSMSYSDMTCVNSNFTKSEVMKAFPKLSKQRSNTPPSTSMTVLYPAIDLNKFIPPNFESKSKKILHDKIAPIVSLNRFERKKNIDVLLYAYSTLLKLHGATISTVLPPLIISGGYDRRNIENVEYLEELKSLAKELNIEKYTTFRPSVSDEERAELLQSALCVVYTPHREHFGIVPLEAMYAGSAVVAGNSGGPTETVMDGQTGLLVDMTPGEESSSQNLANALNELLLHPERAIEMGKVGHLHVSDKFGLTPFRMQWKDIILNKAIPNGEQRSHSQASFKLWGLAFFILVIAIFAASMNVLSN